MDTQPRPNPPSWQDLLKQAAAELREFLEDDSFEITLRYKDTSDYTETQWIASTNPGEFGILKLKAFGECPLSAARSLIVALKTKRPDWRE